MCCSTLLKLLLIYMSTARFLLKIHHLESEGASLCSSDSHLFTNTNKNKTSFFIISGLCNSNPCSHYLPAKSQPSPIVPQHSSCSSFWSTGSILPIEPRNSPQDLPFFFSIWSHLNWPLLLSMLHKALWSPDDIEWTIEIYLTWRDLKPESRLWLNPFALEGSCQITESRRALPDDLPCLSHALVTSHRNYQTLFTLHSEE